jgi:hypothetical protein
LEIVATVSPLAFLDPGHLVSRGVLENEGLPYAQRLAVDPIGAVALVVLDPEVIADGQQPRSHEKPLAVGRVVATSQKTHVPIVWRRPGRRITRSG